MRQWPGFDLEPPTQPEMKTGYAYQTPAGDHWTKPESELWETVVHTATGTETFLGRRRIDGARVNVWAAMETTWRKRPSDEQPQATTTREQSRVFSLPELTTAGPRPSVECSDTTPPRS